MNYAEDEEEIYKVPPQPRSSLGPDHIRPQEETDPPALQPKTGNGFTRSASLLDRPPAVVAPKPAPRHSFQRKASIDSAELYLKNVVGDGIARDRKWSLTTFPVSIDLAEVPEMTDNIFDSALRTAVISDGQQSAFQQQEDGASSKDASSDDLSDTGIENVVVKVAQQPDSASVARPVPKPRQRKSVLLRQSVNSSTCDSTTVNISSPAVPGHMKEKSPAGGIYLPCSESLQNDEVHTNSGLLSAQNNDAAADLTETVPEINHITSASSNNEDDEYVNPDIIRESLPPHSFHADESGPPKPHFTSTTQSYLQMQEKRQQAKTLTGSPAEADFGSNLFSDSSPGSMTVSECVPKKFEANPSAVTIPKPFDDIKPFQSKVSMLSATPGRERQQETGSKTEEHCPEIDPFLNGKSQLVQTKPQNDIFGQTSEPSFGSADSDFVVNWENAFHNSAKSTKGSDKSTEAYRSRGSSAKEAVSEKSVDKLLFHAEPNSSSPPLQQNHCVGFQPPWLPYRPGYTTDPFIPPVTFQAPTQATNTQGQSPTHIFRDLPTPAFIQNQSTDPFQGSNFDLECDRYNKTQVPAPPSGSLPQPHVVKCATPSRETGSRQIAHDAKTCPEHINQFVFPPPSSHEYNQHPTSNDQAKELSSSDSDDTDLVTAEVSAQEWDNGGAPRARLKIFDSSLLLGEVARYNNTSDSNSSYIMTLTRRSVVNMYCDISALTGHFSISWPVLDQCTQPKKNARYGYLYKQGGYKANKGWKKRWVVFNGTNLSYYGSSTAQVSKRIIPVRCMVDVETDIKASDRNSFRFKVVTSLKNRVFVFSSETLDDCLTWANTLMAAITNLKKSSSGTEMTTKKPDREGFIRFGNMKKYYVTVAGKTLSYYQSFEDYQMGSPTHEIDMKLASVKVKDHKKLQLWIHYGHFDLTFENDQDMQNWRMAMEDAIAEGLADDTVLKKVYENMSNQHCADCGEENPHWASINLGIVVCKNCAGVHRMFDYRLSKIRSLRMDTRVWTPSLIEVMVTIGNANANAFWEFELPAGAKVQPTDSMEKRKEFIIKKYKNKKFCNLHPLINQGPVLGDALLNAASSDNVLEMIKILFSGADILYRKDEYGPTAYDVAKEHGQRLIMEFLYQNGGDPQTLEQDVTDENRLREDVRIQGYLNKAGPVGRKFEKRWCILEHGCLTYYLNERSKTFKGSIDRKDMHMIQAVENERIGHSFELSTGLKDSRIFTFSSDSRDDSGEWIRTIAKLMAPVAVMDHVGMIDVKLAAYVHMKESLVDEWHPTFIVFSWRGINYMNRDLKLGYLDLRKASSIKMQDSSNGYMQRGPCFVISSTGKSVYLQATLVRDTEKMFTAFQEAVTSSGSTLFDQALTNENIPVIVERCITHIYMNGLEEKGIYRTAGQNSRVQSLLDEFRKDAWSVSLNEYTVQDVSNVLKRFLRELDDSVFERINYGSWINMAGCKEINHRLMWYKYYLEKMPQVNFQTLKRIVLHLLQVSQHEKVNLMSITNLASCFAPSLMRTAKDEQPNLISDASSKEISIMVDLMNNVDYFFNVNENERVILNNIRQAEIEIQKRIQENGKSVANPATTGILIPVHLLSREGQSVNVLVTEEKTAKDAMDSLKRNKAAPDLEIYVLYEQLFRGTMVRPLFPEDLIAASTNRWMEWESWVMEDNNVCLCVQGLELLEKLNTHFSPNHVLLGKHHYCDSKPKSRFKRRMIGFRQCKLALYTDSQGNTESASWKIEDITVYLGTMHKKPLPPFRYCLTFIVNGEKYTKPPFGHCLSFDTDDELFRWAAALYAAQHPAGLLSWASE